MALLSQSPPSALRLDHMQSSPQTSQGQGLIWFSVRPTTELPLVGKLGSAGHRPSPSHREETMSLAVVTVPTRQIYSLAQHRPAYAALLLVLLLVRVLVLRCRSYSSQLFITPPNCLN